MKRGSVRAAAVLTICLIAPTPAPPDTVTLEAGKDATLIEHPEGQLANGSGPVFFAGRTNQTQNAVRRALVWFDVAEALPHHAIVESVSLTLHLMPGNPGPSLIRLHRVQADWGEGASFASGGGGVPAGIGDVTWLHQYFDGDFWIQAGGQFLGRTSAELVVDQPGVYTWSGPGHLAEDLKLWLAAPHRNFGWILIGDETTPQRSKSFASRESPEPEAVPLLEIGFRMPGQPTGSRFQRR